MPLDIVGLRQQRAPIAEALAGLDISPNATEEQLAESERLSAELSRLDRLIASAEAQQRARATTAKPSPASDPAPTVPAAPTQAAEPGIRFAQITRALVHAKGRVDVAHAFAVATWGESHPVAMEIGAALQANDPQSGGFLVPERYSQEIIELLMPRTTIRRRTALAGNVVPLVGGTDNIPTVESGTNAYYIGEGQDLTVTEPTFGNIRVTEREIGCIVPISNKLLRHASPNVDAMVRNLIVRGMAQAEDLAFLRGTGAGPGPRGIRYWPGITSNPANGTVNLTNIEADARKCELGMWNNDIPMIAPCWLMSPRTFAYLRDLRDGNSNLVYPALQGANPTWRGFPVEVTNNIPINLGGSTDESEVYLVDFAFVMIAESYGLRIDASDTAAYKVGGNMQSAYSLNQTVIRALGGHDFAVTRPKAVSLLTAVKWA